MRQILFLLFDDASKTRNQIILDIVPHHDMTQNIDGGPRSRVIQIINSRHRPKGRPGGENSNDAE